MEKLEAVVSRVLIGNDTELEELLEKYDGQVPPDRKGFMSEWVNRIEREVEEWRLKLRSEMKSRQNKSLLISLRKKTDQFQGKLDSFQSKMDKFEAKLETVQQNFDRFQDSFKKIKDNLETQTKVLENMEESITPKD